MSILNKHVLQNHCQSTGHFNSANQKSNFFNVNIAEKVVKKICKRDKKTLEIKSATHEDRIILKRKFKREIGVDSDRKTRCRVGKVVVDRSGNLITAFPVKRLEER